MTTVQTITSALDDAPRFALLGLSMRDERLRERAKEALAAFLAERVAHPLPVVDADQMRLPL